MTVLVTVTVALFQPHPTGNPGPPGREHWHGKTPRAELAAIVTVLASSQCSNRPSARARWLPPRSPAASPARIPARSLRRACRAAGPCPGFPDERQLSKHGPRLSAVEPGTRHTICPISEAYRIGTNRTQGQTPEHVWAKRLHTSASCNAIRHVFDVTPRHAAQN